MQYHEKPLSPREITPRGLLAARLRLSLERLLRERQMHTKYAGWGADQIGRWIGATILEALLLKEDSALPLIHEKVEELCSAQDAQGFYYGVELQETPERWRECWFGQGRGIWNLLEYFDATGETEALLSVQKAADLAVTTQGTWEISKPLCGGIESVVGPMARLGRQTERPEYVAYARWLADSIQHQVAKPAPVPTAHVEPTSLHTHEEKPFYHHTHSYLNTTHGVLDLAVVTGEQRYLEQAKQVFEDSFSSVWINGDFPESYGDYYERIDETCSTVDWVVLGLKLFALTGEVRYLDSVELSAWNHLTFGQSHDGTFTCYRSVNRHHWANDHNKGFPQNECCAMSGGWGLSQLALYTLTENEKGISVNLPFEISATLERESGEVHIAQSLWTGCHEMVQTLQIENDSALPLEIKLRVPYWCPEPLLRVNGLPSAKKAQDGILLLSCDAETACSIELHLPMHLSIIPAERNILTKNRPAVVGDAKEQGLQYGPYVLMLSRVMYPEIVQKDVAVTILLNGDGTPKVRQVCPEAWHLHHGAVPLLVEAEVEGSPVLLTPCANTTMTRFTVDDPYLLRFAEIKLHTSA